MSYERYREYKDSGIEWLGEVPAHWHVHKLKFLADYITRGDSPTYVDESNVKVVNQACVQYDGLALDRVRYNINVDISAFKGKLLRQDILINSTGTGTLGRVALFDIDADNYMADGHVTIIRDTVQRLVPKYVYYYLRPRQEWITAYASDGATNQIELNREKLRNILLPVPPLPEQHAIAAFLDNETARIDGLIAKQEQMISLLQEKRKALISNAVTRGINPDAPMKDSGVARLGMVPEHWEVKRLSKEAVQITNGYVGPTRDILVEEGVRYIQSLHVKNGSIRFDKPYFVRQEWSNQHQRTILREGDLLIVQTGAIGQCCAVPQEFAGSNCHALIIARFTEAITGFFMAAFFQSSYGENALLSTQTGALHPHLETSNVRDIHVLVPPLHEQQQILDCIAHETFVIDILVDKASTAINLLKEHRTSLISAAVTGKIDVRRFGEREPHDQAS